MEKERVDIFYKKKGLPAEDVWSTSVITKISTPGTLHFTRLKHKVEYYNFNIERADGTKATLSEADLPQLNPVDLLTLSTHFKSLVAKYPQCKPIYDSISSFLKDYLYEIGRIDHELYGMFENIPEPPHPVNNLPEIQQLFRRCIQA